MNSSSYVLSEATLDDLPEIVDLECELFSGWCGYVALGLGDSIPHKLCIQARYHHAIASDPTAHLLKITETKTNRIIGMAIWNLYTTPLSGSDWDSQTAFDYSPDVPSFSNLLAYNNGLNSNRKRLMDGKPFALVRWLGISSSHRRKGLATQLLTWGMKKADEHEMECMLEASREGETVYVHYGFESRGEYWTEMKDENGEAIHGGKLMVRPAQKKV